MWHSRKHHGQDLCVLQGTHRSCQYSGPMFLIQSQCIMVVLQAYILRCLLGLGSLRACMLLQELPGPKSRARQHPFGLYLEAFGHQHFWGPGRFLWVCWFLSVSSRHLGSGQFCDLLWLWWRGWRRGRGLTVGLSYIG